MQSPLKKRYDEYLDPSEAVQIQKRLRAQIKIQPLHQAVRTIGGADISFDRFSTTAYAAFVVLDIRSFALIDRSFFVGEMNFPYIPGLLSFREIPVLLKAWEQLQTKPDVLCLDGQGIAHPRRMGIATHFGILTDFPTIGCAKSRLVGLYQEPANEPRSYEALMDRDELVGFAYRTKRNTAPIFISPGNRIDFQGTLDVLNQLECRYRIPEPTRQAHLLANEFRRTRGKLSLKAYPGR